MKKYSILSLLSIVLLAGCSFLPQSTENPIEQPQVFSGVWWTVPSDD